jgi:hypothetical protein
MPRGAIRVAALAVCCLLSACHGAHGPAGPPDQSSTFFPGSVDTYGLTLAAVDRDHLAELDALRRIDPCGFVDRETLAAHGHTDFSYTYSAVNEIPSEGASPVFPVGRDGCTVGFPSSATTLALRMLPGEIMGNDSFFAPVPAHPGISSGRAPNCASRVSLPLSRLRGAPATMRDPVVEVTLQNTTGRWELTHVDDSLCALVENVAESIATRVQAKGVPAFPGDSRGASKFLTGDPCAAASDLHAKGFIWRSPAPEAQWPTTWRHPSVCDLRLDEAGSDSATASAVVKYGLAAWTDSTVQSPSGQVPTRRERDGVVLFVFASCFVVAKAGSTIAPTNVGTGAPNLVARTPVATVRMVTPGDRNCAAVAEDTALATLKRAAS